MPHGPFCILTEGRDQTSLEELRQESRLRPHGRAIGKIGHQNAVFHTQPSP